MPYQICEYGGFEGCKTHGLFKGYGARDLIIHRKVLSQPYVVAHNGRGVSCLQPPSSRRVAWMVTGGFATAWKSLGFGRVGSNHAVVAYQSSLSSSPETASSAASTSSSLI